jgi:hypothetical protein
MVADLIVSAQARDGKDALGTGSHGKMRLDSAARFRDAMHMPVDADALDQSLRGRGMPIGG